MKKTFFADTAIVALVLFGIVSIGGLVSGEAGIIPVLAAVLLLSVFLFRRKCADLRAKVMKKRISKYIDYTHAA